MTRVVRDARARILSAAALVSVIATIATIAVAQIPLAERRSGYDFMSRATKAMQDEDTANPAMLWALDGEALWNRKAGAADKSCADCHRAASATMKGVAARYPAFNAARGRPVNLEQRINICRTEQQKAPPFAYESKELLALAIHVGRQSRGQPISVAIDERTKPFLDNGRTLYNLRQGQLNLACNHCHDDNWGKKLAGNVVPQGHATGYPIYRLEWQNVGSLQRRLRNCLTGMRAVPYAFGAPEFVDLELYLMWRARGMPVETPAVWP